MSPRFNKQPGKCVAILSSLSDEEMQSIGVDKMVEHWWKEQLFLGIRLGDKNSPRGSVNRTLLPP